MKRGVVGGVVDLPHDLLRLLQNRIHSATELQVLLLLYEAPSIEWTTERVAESVGLHVEGTRGALIRLSRRGLIVAHRGGPQLAFSCADTDPELNQALQRVSALYARHRSALLTQFDT